MGHPVAVSPGVDVVRREGALQGAGLLRVDLLPRAAVLGAGAEAAAGVGRAVGQNGTLGWGTG